MKKNTLTKEQKQKLKKLNFEEITNNPELWDALMSEDNSNLDNALNKAVDYKTQKLDAVENDEFEELRQTAKKDKKKANIISAIIVVIMIFLWYLILKNFGPYLANIDSEFILAVIGLSMFGAVGAIQLAFSKAGDKYIDKYKEDIVKNILESIFTNVIYQPDKGIPEEVIDATKTIETGSYHSNDYIEADYNGVHFIQSDVYTYYDYDNGREVYFQGRWMIFNFNKEFKANIQVIPKSFKHSKKIKNFKSNVKYEKIEMEDVSFNEQFKVYAQNKYDAYYILTPHIMDKIRELSNNINGDIIFHFSNNQLHIGINNGRDAFEVDIDTQLNPTFEKEKILYETNLITKFINELKLDMQLFKS